MKFINMNKALKAFLSASFLLSTAFAGPIVNKLGQNSYSNEISSGLESVIGSPLKQPIVATAIPFYETFPVSNYVSLKDVKMVPKTDDASSVVLVDYVSVKAFKNEGTALGLRMALAPEESRLEVAQQMAESGLIKTGDILVSTRPLFANSLQYLSLQLEATHVSTAVVMTENGRKVVYNLDIPMDDDMLGGAKLGFGRSVLDSNHFVADNTNLMLHVLRPRFETEKQKENMQKWLERGLMRAREKQIYPASISFNTNYNSPMYRENNGQADLSFVADTARLLLGQGLMANQHLQMFCSEFAWTLLSLRNCDPDTTAKDFAKGQTPSCVSEFYKPMQMFGSAFSSGRASDQDLYGMTDGIPLLLGQTGADSQAMVQFIDYALPGIDREAKGLSNGHKAVAAMMEPLIKQANGYFKLTLTRNTQQIDGARSQLNPNSPRNYSPTAFVVHASMPDTINGVKVAQKKLDYVVTLKYVPKALLKKAQSK